MIIERAVTAPKRAGLSISELWHGEDCAVIVSWERGRELARENPDLADQARDGVLVVLPWKGGLDKPIKGIKYGSHRYLAMWQGLRGEDLYINSESEFILSCSLHRTEVVFLNDQELLATMAE